LSGPPTAAVLETIRKIASEPDDEGGDRRARLTAAVRDALGMDAGITEIVAASGLSYQEVSKIDEERSKS
jgi:hypothetical protein